MSEGTRKRRKRRWPYFLLVVVLLLGGGFLYIRRMADQVAGRYTSVVVQRGDLEVLFSFTGTIHAPNMQTITAGQSASVRLAARYARSMGRSWLLVLPVDMPFVSKDHVRRMCRCAQQNPDTWAVVSLKGSMPMAPCLFASQAFRYLEALSGDAGAAKVIRSPEFRQRCVSVPFASEREAFDVDTPKDLELAKAMVL